MDGELPALPAATLIRGRASEALDLLPAESVRTVVTSPPYWSLRVYDIEDPFGRNDTLGDYVANIVADFRQLRRALKGDGTIWPYAGSGTTLLAAAQLRRRWVGIELKAEFVLLIERRMNG